MSLIEEVTPFVDRCRSLPEPIRNIIVDFSGKVVDKRTYSNWIKQYTQDTQLYIKRVNPGDSLCAYYPDELAYYLAEFDYSQVLQLEDQIEVGDVTSDVFGYGQDSEVTKSDFERQRLRLPIREGIIHVISPIHFLMQYDYDTRQKTCNQIVEAKTFMTGKCYFGTDLAYDVTYTNRNKENATLTIHDTRGVNFLKLSPTKFSIFVLNMMWIGMRRLKDYKFVKGDVHPTIKAKYDEVIVQNLFIKERNWPHHVQTETFNDRMTPGETYKLLANKENIKFKAFRNGSPFVCPEIETPRTFNPFSNRTMLDMSFFETDYGSEEEFD